MGRHSRLTPLVDLVTGTAGIEDEELRERPDLRVTDERLELLARWKADPWAFMTGVDTDGRPILWTQDERDREQSIKPFPAHLDYLHYLVDLLQNEPKLAIEKSSQMIVTTTILLHSAWDCAFREGIKVMLSKHKEAEAEALLRDKVKVPWSHLPEWLRRLAPVKPKPANKATFPKTNSMIWGLTENAAAAEARSNTYTRGLIDEAEFQDMLPGLITAMLPRTDQLVMWSTPNYGGAGTTAFKKYVVVK